MKAVKVFKRELLRVEGVGTKEELGQVLRKIYSGECRVEKVSEGTGQSTVEVWVYDSSHVVGEGGGR
jgi:hypothetical protein